MSRQLITNSNSNRNYNMSLGNFVTFESNFRPCLAWPLVINDKDDRSGIKFHITSDDYFGTLATILDLMKQEKIKIDKKHSKLLEKLKDDLLFLQKHYKITKKRE